MLIIGFGNKSRQGKDTAAEAIKDHFDRLNSLHHRHLYKLSAKPVNVGIFKFATALYQEVADYIGNNGGAERVFGLIENGLAYVPSPYTPSGLLWIPTRVTIGDMTPSGGLIAPAPYGKHPKLLQWWGTDYRRNNFGENYWVDKMFTSIPVNIDIALISDVRFPSEAEAIKQRGGFTVNVQRLNKDGSQYYSTDRPSDHPSEVALDSYSWDYYIKSKEGDAAWTAEQAITLAEYLRGIKS